MATGTQTGAALPAGLESFRGRITDMDSHLLIPTSEMGAAFGKTGQVVGPLLTFAKRFDKTAKTTPSATPAAPSPITPDIVWTAKGDDAPGGADAAARIETLDLMGLRRQLVFPDVLSAFVVWGRQPGARGAMRAHNDFALDWASGSDGRLVPAAILNVANLDAAVAEAERIAAKGASAVMIPDGVPPGGLSPAHPDVDRLWAVLAEAGVAVLLHIGGQHGFTTGVWEQADLLRTNVKNLGSDGDPIGPHTLATMHLSPVNYLSTLIFGGVLERHPSLRVGVMELGAMWVGPMMELLDNRAQFSTRVSKGLSMKPSEYVQRSVRVTPFYQEPVGHIIERYQLEDVLCFASDFPHREGGTDPLGATFASLKGLSPRAIEKFYVTNGELILGQA